VKNPDLVGAAVKAQVPEVDARVVSDEFRAAVPLVKNDVSERDGIGALEPALVKTTWDTLAKSLNIPPDKINPEQLINRSFIAAK